jgi:hypothetical protein
MYTLHNSSTELNTMLATIPQPVFHYNNLLASVANTILVAAELESPICNSDCNLKSQTLNSDSPTIILNSANSSSLGTL